MAGRERAPSSPSSVVEDLASVLVMTYDPTGTQWVRVSSWPIIAWTYDLSNPVNPKPMTIGNPIKTPPSTGAIASPAWAYCLGPDAVFVSDEFDEWRGTLAEFFDWIATNNGASRKVDAWFTWPALLNVWNKWSYGKPGIGDPKARD